MFDFEYRQTLEQFFVFDNSEIVEIKEEFPQIDKNINLEELFNLKKNEFYYEVKDMNDKELKELFVYDGNKCIKILNRFFKKKVNEVTFEQFKNMLNIMNNERKVLENKIYESSTIREEEINEWYKRCRGDNKLKRYIDKLLSFTFIENYMKRKYIDFLMSRSIGYEKSIFFISRIFDRQKKIKYLEDKYEKIGCVDCGVEINVEGSHEIQNNDNRKRDSGGRYKSVFRLKWEDFVKESDNLRLRCPNCHEKYDRKKGQWMGNRNKVLCSIEDIKEKINSKKYKSYKNSFLKVIKEIENNDYIVDENKIKFINLIFRSLHLDQYKKVIEIFRSNDSEENKLIKIDEFNKEKKQYKYLHRIIKDRCENDDDGNYICPSCGGKYDLLIMAHIYQIFDKYGNNIRKNITSIKNADQIIPLCNFCQNVLDRRSGAFLTNKGIGLFPSKEYYERVLLQFLRDPNKDWIKDYEHDPERIENYIKKYLDFLKIF